MTPQKKLPSKSPALLVLMKQFLEDENGDVDVIEIGCLKPRVGLSTVMEDTPHHVIDGPLEVLPLRGKKWDVPHNEHIAAHFREVSGFDREALKNMQ